MDATAHATELHIDRDTALEQRVLVLGCGSIGNRHLNNLRELGCTTLAVCDEHPGRLDGARAADCAAYADWDAAVEDFRPTAVLVCTPPAYHVAQARAALEAGAHAFVEKPVGHTLDGLDDLEQRAALMGRVVQVGYNMRFDPALLQMRDWLQGKRIGTLRWARLEFGQYLPDWRPQRDYRDVYTARAALGGGIILDGSHEIDLALWLCGPPDSIVASSARVSDLDMDTEDYAALVLEYADGRRVEVHLDCVRRAYTRRYVLCGSAGTIEWDDATRCVRLQPAGAEPQDLHCPLDANHTYMAELVDFLRCACGRGTPRVGLAQGRAALACALAAQRAARDGRRVHLG